MTDRQVFVDSLKDTAIKGWEDYQILPSIFTAQTAHETGYGTSALAENANNYWGIKIKEDEEGYAYHHKTWEVIDGKRVEPIEPFKWFEDWSDGVAGYYNVFHGSDWRKDNYSAVIGETDYKKAAQALSNAGYATDPSYPQRLTDLIEEYELYKWDEEAIGKPTEETYDLEEGQVVIDGEIHNINEIEKGNE